MAKKNILPSMILLMSLRPRSSCRQCIRRALSHGRDFHHFKPVSEEKKPFRMQLYQSTSERIERERAQQARFSRLRGPPKNISDLWILTLVAFASSIGCYYVGTLNPQDPVPASTSPLASVIPPLHNESLMALQTAWVEIVEIIGEDNVSTDEKDLQHHSGSDWSSYKSNDTERLFMVARPSTTEEVSSIVKICHERKIPITAYSGGTSLEGHFFPTRGGVCIDFSRMDKLLKLHKGDLDVVVQPGLGWEVLNEELAPDGLFFPPDPGPGAMIGGMIGTGCSGTNAFRYGTMKDWVVSLTVVLADGTIIKTRQRPRKSSAGYDLTRIFVGSEGTLGLVTEATLKVAVKPKSESVAVASFSTIRDAAECVASIVGEGVSLAAVEILDDIQMQCINESGSTTRSWKEAPTLFFKFAGTPLAVKEQVSIVKNLAQTRGSKSFEFAKNADEAQELWSARKDALWSVMAKRRDQTDHVWTTDVAVPMSRLPDIIQETKDDMSKSGLLATIVGHVGDGNFHAIILFNDKERKIAQGVVHRMVKRAVEMEGTVSGEHGVGLIKRDYLAHELGESTVDTMRKLKQALDPLCLFNCDKVIRMEEAKSGEVKPW